MSDVNIRIRSRGGKMHMPRSRGAATGLLLIVLGLWGALIPFLGPYFNFAFTPDQEWAWTAARGWLQVLPGVVTVLGGLLLTLSDNRATAMLGAWMSGLAGAWFVAGRAVAAPLNLGAVGTPVATTETKAAWLELTYFSGLGALIIFFAAVCIGRLSVRSLRDIRRADAPVTLAEDDAGRGADPITCKSVEPVEKSETSTDDDHYDKTPRRRRVGDLFRRRHSTSAR
ncbi:hypothetical protein [Mycolicibacterium tusciae]|uniref:Secreted protein n=1 Tax=Mycolicibacterium tusciae TaxID=75922 RepID=A0A1X0K1B8_9MYCO|nr:hypothetical protein [Mycolicibacterium tusciae]ORB68934.1 hypothetical protein BST47_02195 [Mycolicibacterium tusciae]